MLSNLAYRIPTPDPNDEGPRRRFFTLYWPDRPKNILWTIAVASLAAVPLFVDQSVDHDHLLAIN
jgi:hypothetical protein